MSGTDIWPAGSLNKFEVQKTSRSLLIYLPQRVQSQNPRVLRRLWRIISTSSLDDADAVPAVSGHDRKVCSCTCATQTDFEFRRCRVCVETDVVMHILTSPKPPPNIEPPPRSQHLPAFTSPKSSSNGNYRQPCYRPKPRAPHPRTSMGVHGLCRPVSVVPSPDLWRL